MAGVRLKISMDKQVVQGKLFVVITKPAKQAPGWLSSNCLFRRLTMAYKDRNLLAVIGDEVRISHFYQGIPIVNFLQDSITGLLLAGVGHLNGQQKNFLVVDASKRATTFSEKHFILMHRLSMC